MWNTHGMDVDRTFNPLVVGSSPTAPITDQAVHCGQSEIEAQASRSHRPSHRPKRFSIRERHRGMSPTAFTVRWREEGVSRESHPFATRADAMRHAVEVVQAEKYAPLKTAPRTLYALQAGVDGPIKIGVTASPSARLRSLQTGHFERLYLLGVGSGTLGTEQEMHAALEPYRIRGEWFRPTPPVIEAVEAIRARVAA